MQEQIDKIEAQLDEAVKEVNSSKSLLELRSKFLSKTGKISELMKSLRDVPAEQRPSMGKLLNALRCRVEERFNELDAKLKKFELEKRNAEEKIDVTLPDRKSVV